jgi:beta-galactosidase
MTLTISSTQFLLDGKPFRILSGAMHYFRAVPEYWRDRLEKMRAFGLNTVETYVAWNLHEPRPNEFRFDGMLDIVKFIETADEVGLKVIVRPGPYICSEWDFGGLPFWLLKDPHMQVRCAYPAWRADHRHASRERIRQLWQRQSLPAPPRGRDAGARHRLVPAHL